jgi:hypothetical protein
MLIGSIGRRSNLRLSLPVANLSKNQNGQGLLERTDIATERYCDGRITSAVPSTANHDNLGIMSASDDALIIRRLIQSLEANLSELDIELGEEAPLESPRLDSAEHILQNAIKELGALIKPEK